MVMRSKLKEASTKVKFMAPESGVLALVWGSSNHAVNMNYLVLKRGYIGNVVNYSLMIDLILYF